MLSAGLLGLLVASNLPMLLSSTYPRPSPLAGVTNVQLSANVLRGTVLFAMFPVRIVSPQPFCIVVSVLESSGSIVKMGATPPVVVIRACLPLPLTLRFAHCLHSPV